MAEGIDAPEDRSAKREPRERQFERVLDRLPQGVVVVDRDLRIDFMNTSAKRLLKLGDPREPDEPLPDPWPDFSLRELAASVFTGLATDGAQIVDTGERTLSVEGVAAAELPSAILILDDVTTRERLRETERRFVENAAHELRTPLAAIVSMIEVLESGAKDDPPIRDRFLGHLQSSSERLSRLTLSLLVLARIQTGQEQAHFDLVPARPLLEEVAAELEPAETVEIEVDADPKVAMLADRDLVFHALSNVASNAVKHTSEGQISFVARDLGSTTELAVRDTGTGMTREEAAQAFERFYGSGSRDGDSGGFGLGLAIAQEAVHALGGTIELESEPDVGTCVRIRVPSARLVKS
jgi:signal transduction histidine kinase